MARIYKSHNANKSGLAAVRLGQLGLLTGTIVVLYLQIMWQWTVSAQLVVVIVCVTAAVRLRQRAAILKSGLAGEAAAVRLLSGLPDSCTVMCNLLLEKRYCAELDAVVVAPGGVFLIEVKNHAGEISGCLQDDVWQQRRAVRGGRMIQRSIPSPVKQSRRQVRLVRSIFHGHLSGCPVWGCVYFSNPYAVVDVQGKRIFTDGEALCAVIASAEPVLTDEKMQTAVQLLYKARIKSSNRRRSGR